MGKGMTSVQGLEEILPWIGKTWVGSSNAWKNPASRNAVSSNAWKLSRQRGQSTTPDVDAGA